MNRLVQWLVAFGVAVIACSGIVWAQSDSIVVKHREDPDLPGYYHAFEDLRGCTERVRDSQSHWTGATAKLLWNGICAGGLRDGPGMLKLFSGRALLVASHGSYVNGARDGLWTWEFPDGRRLEARFTGSGREPLERVFESAKGERVRQVLIDGRYEDDTGVPPPPEGSTERSVTGAQAIAPSASRNAAADYAAAHFRVASCSPKGKADPRWEYGSLRRDVDRFVRVGEVALRAEAESDVRALSRALTATALRSAGALGGTDRGGTDHARAVLGDPGEVRDHLEWVRCHLAHGIPYLARMQQSVASCERRSMFKLAAVRASRNPRLQAEFADCLHAEIHSSQWSR